MGKTIKRYHYLPMLDDANINDQGIDASGLTATFESVITAYPPDASGNLYGATDYPDNMKPLYFVGNHATVDATAITAAKTAYIQWVEDYFPNQYAAMAHSTVAADYAICIATGEAYELQTITVGVITNGDVFTLTYQGVSLTYTIGTATVNGLVAGLIASPNAGNYANMPFVLAAGDTPTTTSGTMTLTWKAYGYVADLVTFTAVGTSTESVAQTTPGTNTMYDIGWVTTLVASQTGAGNLWGSSKDIGYINDRLPTLTENGGRVNRVGFKRIDLEGSIEKFGFFDEYTQESLDFDTDAELEMHINREMLFAANEITEDMIQMDLLTGAGVIRYAGDAVSNATMTGVTADTVSEVTYDDLSRLSIDLDNNRCPKHTKIITGSRMIDTKVIPAARIMYIGTELQPTVERMTDHFGNQAFIPLAHYASAGSEINGEIGTVGGFRIVVVPEMMHWADVGAAEGVNAGYRVSGGNYNVYPMLVIGSESFTTIGFQTSGKSVKFKIYHKKPGAEQATTADPYGETGFMSIKWYYGSMILRSERIALVKSVARL